MWPDLTSIGVSIHIDRGDKNRGLVLFLDEKNADKNVNRDALVAHGFVPDKIGDKTIFLLKDKLSFKSSDLLLWFPSFDKKIHINREADPSFLDIESLRTNSDGKSERIEDVGEKFGGAKKDLAKKRSFLNATDDEKSKVCASDLWGYSYKAAHDSGVSCSVATWIYGLRHKIPSARQYDVNNFELYENLLNLLSDRLGIDRVKTPDDLMRAIAEIGESSELKEFDGVYSGRKASDFAYLLRFATHNQHVLFGDGGKILHTSNYKPKPDDERVWTKQLVWSYGHEPKLYLDDHEYADHQWQNIGGLPRDRKEQKDGDALPGRPHLTHLENKLNFEPDLPPGGVTAELLMDRFGFRGVEFGEWLPQDERQTVIDYAFYAFSALASVMGIPDKYVGFNRRLGIAFGSRGRGKAMAHYEPDRLVINLTRINGAGSLAHEWGHALDNYLGEMHGIKDGWLSSDPGQEESFKNVMRGILYVKMPELAVKESMDTFAARISWASSWMNKKYKKTNKDVPVDQIILHNILKRAKLELPNLMDIDSKSLRDGSALSALNMDWDDSVYSAIDRVYAKDIYDDVNQFFGKPFTDSPESIRSGKSHAAQMYWNLCTTIEHLQKASKVKRDKDSSYVFTDSSFLLEARKLDKKNSKAYWSSSKELFARAFESFVFDEMHKSGCKQDYLVHGVEEGRYASGCRGNPYPVGNERAAINESMKNLASFLAEDPKFYNDNRQPLRRTG